jgi:hypothetical protein
MTRHLLESGERRPDLNMTALIVTASPAGAIVAIAVFVTGFAGLPEARPFFLASAALGILLGLILYWNQR